MEKLLEISSLKLWLLLMLLLTIRYVVVAGVPYLWLYVIGKDKFDDHKIQKNHPEKEQVFEEIKYSLITFCVYSSGIWAFLYWLQNGFTQNYTKIN